MSLGLAHVLRLANQSMKVIARSIRAEYLPTMFHGRWIWVRTQAWDTAYLRYERHVARSIRQHLAEGGVFYDIGAHVGLWSLFAVPLVGTSGQIVCCEPSDAFELLQKNTCGMKQVCSLNVAVGDRVQEIDFFGQGCSMSGSVNRAVTRINEHFSSLPVRAVTVQMQTLDALFQSARVPDLIKVDVEGYEQKVLEGAQVLMSRAAPAWLVEIHPPQLCACGDSKERCHELLQDFGYDVRIINTDPNSIYAILATRRREQPTTDY